MAACEGFSTRRVFAGDGDPTGPPGDWRVTLPNGDEVCWKGFSAGPLSLGLHELEQIARELLGMGLDQVPAAASRELRPYISDGGPAPGIVLQSATPSLRNLEADLDEIIRGVTPDDPAAYLETRSINMARPGDVVVGRIHPWKIAAACAGVEAVVIPGIDYYYLSQAILKLALESRGRAPAIARLAEILRRQPETVARIYSLDREMQIILLYLKRLAGIEVLYTDANRPEVADHWNAKAPLHPTAGEALAVDPGPLGPHELLAAESALAPAATRLGLRFTPTPGYSILPDETGEEGFTRQLLLAGRLLAERYGLRSGCFKPSQGGGGARIVTHVVLDEPHLRDLASRTRDIGEPYVLEAQVDYLRRDVGGESLIMAPSGHVRHGHVAAGLMLQFTCGTSWRGNLYLDARSCATVGVSERRYRAITSAMDDWHAAFDRCGLGLVTAGIDFAIGRVGGIFGDQVLVSVQDPNLSANGAEYLRLFLEDQGVPAGLPYGATKVVNLAGHATLPAIRDLESLAPPGVCYRVLGSVPGRWGMIAAAAESSVAGAEAVLTFQQSLSERGYLG